MSTEAQRGLPEGDKECLRLLIAECQLFEQERDTVKHEEHRRGSLRVAPITTVATSKSPASFARTALAAALTLVAAVLAVAAVGLQPTKRAIPDMRFAVDYREQSLTTFASSPATGDVFVGTAGNGLLGIRVRSEYLRQITRDSSAGGLLTDHVRKVVADSGRLFLLCCDEADQVRGVCEYDVGKRTWRTLIRMDRFPELTDANRTARIMDVVSDGDAVYVATDFAGLGLYSFREHGWRRVFRAGPGGLKHNELRDVQRIPKGGLYVATAGGLQILENDVLSDVRLPGELTKPDIVAVQEFRDQILLRTAAGGLYRQDGDKWVTVASESSWGTHGEQDLRFVVSSSDLRTWWCLSRRGAVGRYDFATRSWQSLPSLPVAGSSLALHPAADGRLLAGSESGVLEWSRGDDAWKTVVPTSSVAALSASSLGAVAATQPPDANLPLGVTFLPREGDPRIMVGEGPTGVDPAGITAVAMDEDGQRLHVGGRSGLRSYELATHAWRSSQSPELGQASILDLQPLAARQLVLRADGTVHSWDPRTDKAIHQLGGGVLPADLKDVSAVTRSTNGRLYLASSRALFAYDERSHVGRKLTDLPADASGLWAAQNGVWLLADGRAYFYSEAGEARATPALPARLERLFASPESLSAVGLDATGRVFQFDSPDVSPIPLVGDPAPGLDLNAVTSAAARGDRLVVGGATPHVYEGRSRSWRRLGVSQVEQVISAAGAAWLRTADRKLYRLADTDAAPQEIVERHGVVALDGDRDRVAVLQADHSIWLIDSNQQSWRQVKAAAQGPAALLLASPTLKIGGGPDVVDLAGGEQGEWWRFFWNDDQWRKVSAQQPLTGISALESTADATFALSRGELYHVPFTGFQAVKASDRRFETLRPGGGEALAVDREGGVWGLRAMGARSLTGAAWSGGGALRDAETFAGGLVVTTGDKSAWLGPDLALWRPIGDASDPLRTLHRAGDQLFAVDDSRRLWYLTDVGGTRKWTARPFDGAPDDTVKAVAENTGAAGRSLTVVTNAGAVVRQDGVASKTLRVAATPLGSPDDVVAVAPATNGYVCALRTGRLLYCRSGSLEWNVLPSPMAAGYADLLATKAALGGYTYWLLTTNNELYFNAAGPGGDWSLAAKDVESIASGGPDAIYAAAPKRLELTKFAANGGRTELLRGKMPNDTEFGKSGEGEPGVAAGEIVAQEPAARDPRSAPTVALLLSDGQRTAAYDPARRVWSSLAVPATSFHPTRDGTLAFTDAGQVIKLTWIDGKFATKPIKLPTGTIPEVALRGDDRLVVRKGAGDLALLDDQGRLTEFIQRQLPVARGVTLRHIAAHGKWFFAACSDDAVYGYHADQRNWRLLGKVPGLTRLEAWSDQAWVESGVAGGQRLSVWREGEQGFVPLPGTVVEWRLTPAGIAAAIRDVRGQVDTALWRGPVDPTPLALRLPAGPREDSITATRDNNHGLWLRDEQSLYYYDGQSHGWKDVAPVENFKIQTALFRGSSPVILDAAGDTWMGVISSPGIYPTWKFQRGPRQVSAFDVDKDVMARITTAGHLVTSRLSAVDEPLGQRERTLAWTRNSPLQAAVAKGDQLWTANAQAEVAHYDWNTRVWQRAASLPAVPQHMSWIDDRLVAILTNGQVARLDDGRWTAAEASSQPTWSAGDKSWRVHPAGWITNAEDATADAADAPNRELTSVEPRRIAARDDVLYVEMADGSLVAYDVLRGRLKLRVPRAAANETRRVGLVQAGKSLFFVAEQEQRVLVLGDTDSEVRNLGGFKTERVLALGDEIALDSGEELLFPHDLRRIAGAARILWAQKAQPPANDRLQASAEWRIESPKAGAPGRLAREIAGKWTPYLLDARRSRFLWDDVTSGVSWGERMLLATSVGIVVTDIDDNARPRQLLPIDTVDEQPLNLKLFRFAKEGFAATSQDGRVWRLAPGPSQSSLTASTVAPPQSRWRVLATGDGPQLTARLTGDVDVPISLSLAGELGVDHYRSVCVVGDAVFVATRDGLLEMPADLASVRAVHQVGAGKVAPHPDTSGLAYWRETDGKVLTWANGRWEQAQSPSWDRVVKTAELRERTDMTKKIVLPVKLTDSAPAVMMPYQKGRLACDVIEAPRGRAIFSANEDHLWLGNSLGLLRLPRQSKPRGENVGDSSNGARFLSIPGGIVNLEWRLHEDSPSLVAWSADGRAYRVDSGELTKVDDAAIGERQIRWNDLAYRADEQTPNSVKLVSQVPAATPRTLVLGDSFSGFRHDFMTGVGASARSIWVAYGPELERWSLVSNPRQSPTPFSSAPTRFQLPMAASIQFRRDGESLLAIADDARYRLPDDGEPERMRSDEGPPRDPLKSFQGLAWRVDNVPALVGVRYLRGTGDWQPSPIRRPFGFTHDVPRRLAFVGGDLFFETPAGVTRAPAADVDLAAATSAPLGVADGVPLLPERFHAGSDGRLWVRTRNDWRWFDETARTWRVQPNLPDAERDLANKLCVGDGETWLRTSRGIEIRRALDSGNVVVEWQRGDSKMATPEMALQDVLAAAEIGDDLWFLTPGRLWKQNVPNGQITLGLANADFRGDRAEFEIRDGAWRLVVHQGERQSAFAYKDGSWTATMTNAEASRRPRQVWAQPKFRVFEQNGALSFELLNAEGRWTPTGFDATRGQFIFQQAKDAIGDDSVVHTLGIAGVATWLRGNGGLQFAGWNESFVKLHAPADSKQPLASGRDNVWHVFNGQTWKPIPTPTSSDQLFVTSGWRAVRGPNSDTILQRAVAKGQWIDMPLSANGDFEYRRPLAIALHSESLVARSPKALVEYSAAVGGLANVTPAAALPGFTGPLSDVFVTGGALYASAGNAWARRSPDRTWTPIDSQAADRRRQTIVADDGWHWSRDAQGRARIQRAWKNADQQLEWDPRIGRFLVDQVNDVALVSGFALLSTRVGAVRVDSLTGVPQDTLAGADSPGRFGFDRAQMRLLFQTASDAQAARPLARSGMNWSWGEARPLPADGNCFVNAYHDADWTVNLSRQPRATWRGLSTNLQQGRFRHDAWRALLCAGATCYLESPAGIIVCDLSTGEPQWTRNVPWPSVTPGRLLSAMGGRLHVRAGRQTFATGPAPGEWSVEAETENAAERVLVESPYWRWIRDDQGVKAIVKRSDQDAPRNLLATGRFPFDTVRAVLADGGRVWLGVDEGLVAREMDDGHLVRWYANGDTPQGPRPLGRIARLGRFDEQGNPLPESVADSVRAAATLYASDVQNQAWRWDAEADEWRLSTFNPWTGPLGNWLVRSSSLQISQLPAGNLRVSCRQVASQVEPPADSDDAVDSNASGVAAPGASPASSASLELALPVAFVNGRFAIDVARGVASRGNQLYVATDGGVLRANADGTLDRLWSHDADSALSLASCPTLNRHSERDELFGRTAAGPYVRLDAAADRWQRFEPDAEYRDAAEVLHRDEFWTWRRWDGAIQVSIERADTRRYDGPLFVDGRFSFDVVRDIHVSDKRLWAVTAGGVMAYAPDDMSVASLFRRASDPESGTSVVIPDQGRFLATREVRIRDESQDFVWNASNWVRTPRLAASTDRPFVDGERLITLSPTESGGTAVSIEAPGEERRWFADAFPDVLPEQVLGVAWHEGEVWLCTANQIVRWRAPR